MAYELRENSGSAFKNRRKENEKHADFTGDAKVGGKVYWVNIWQKTDKNGNPWFSISFREKQEAFAEAKEAIKAAPQGDFDDSIPF